MRERDQTDFSGGLFLLVFGLCAGVYTLAQYDNGSFRAVGPGMVPLTVAGIIAALGGLIAVRSGGRSRGLPSPDWRAAFWVTLAVASFALLVRPFGIVPALTVLMLFGTQMSGEQLNWTQRVAYALGLALASFAVFRYALAVPMSLVSWPW